MKTFIVILLLAIAAGVTWYATGGKAGPIIEIVQPTEAIGQTGELVVVIDSPSRKLSRLDVVIEQNGASVPVFSFTGVDSALLVHEGDRRIRLTRALGKRQIPQLVAGKARIIVSAARPVLFGLREAHSTAEREIEVRLTPPIVGVQSTHHYINLGGSEMVVYQVAPANVASGVRVGEHEYPGFPASGAGVTHADPGMRVAFFALLWDQDPKSPISLYARDDLGNEGRATFDYRVFPKKYRQSRIELDDRFLSKTVPVILQNSPEFIVKDPSDLLASFLRINGDLRRENNARIAALAQSTAPEILWHGPFKQLVNTAVEGGFADQRTYLYKGREVDRQVHLGFDLASTAATPVPAANHGKVIYAGWLGIYGNCVILDHGMGLQSIYAHLSSIDVKIGDTLNEGDRLGRSGSTGLAGGDHLHFTTLIDGNAVTPIDWWSAKWIEDRITRKLREAGGAPGATSMRP